MVQKRQKAISIMMLTMLLLNMVGTTLFIHSHTIDGNHIVHSHPFSGASSSHTHSASSLDAISRSIISEALTPSEMSSECIIPELIIGSTYSHSENYTIHFTSHRQLRAPPVVELS